MTVKRRFKTLMMRKKKRQSEREAEIAQINHNIWAPKDEAEVESTSRLATPNIEPSENEVGLGNESESRSQGKGKIDLNCQPEREEELQAGANRASMMSLLQVASLPLETYLKQNGLKSLAEQQHLPPPQAGAGESEGPVNEEDQCIVAAAAPAVSERENGGGEEEQSGQDQDQNQNQNDAA